LDVGGLGHFRMSWFHLEHGITRMRLIRHRSNSVSDRSQLTTSSFHHQQGDARAAADPGRRTQVKICAAFITGICDLAFVGKGYRSGT
jgi:hypothetical protein